VLITFSGSRITTSSRNMIWTSTTAEYCTGNGSFNRISPALSAGDDDDVSDNDDNSPAQNLPLSVQGR